MHLFRGVFAAALPAVLLLAGCGSGNRPQPPVGVFADLHPNINQNKHGNYPDSFYVPNPIRVHVGQTITWTNRDNDLHDVTSVDGIFGSFPLTLGGQFKWTPTKVGTYYYFCTLHTEMHGEVIVTTR